MAHANFGQNVISRPTHVFTPRTEREVLELLAAHDGTPIRVWGSRHSWSDLIRADHIALDLRHLDQVEPSWTDDGPVATIGAGCRIHAVLQALSRDGLTLPSVGLIDAQTLAGAVATGTHGSGRHCLSHYVRALRIARYDPETGAPTVVTIDNGEALSAAKCALGALGVVLSITMACRRDYRIAEHIRRYATLDDVLAQERDYPLQQFYLIPWHWAYFAQHRQETGAPRSRLAGLYRRYWYWGIDRGLHWVFVTLSRWLRSHALRRAFFRFVMPRLILSHWHVVDRAADMLVMDHAIFRHIEMELFVPADQLGPALHFLRDVLTVADGTHGQLSAPVQAVMDDLNLQIEVDALRGTYTHHYPICIRRVLPDNTCVAMSSGEVPVYAISLISYQRLNDRSGFLQCMRLLAVSMSRQFGARPHWGKVCPLTRSEMIRLYPRWPAFQAACHNADPRGIFANDWTRVAQ